MSIHMIGTDHSIANVDVRSQFSFTKKSMDEVLPIMKSQPGILSVVLLSTCNRMELYVNAEEGLEPDLVQLLCDVKGLNPEEYRDYLVVRREKEAVEHLFYLTCGLKSRILAEDQILTQVKTALALSREVYCTDHVLEVLFRNAVAAAKRVKTEVAFTHANQTAMDQAIAMLKREEISLDGMTAMVIGNGEMGKLCANSLVKAGANVTVTVRQYRSGVVDIPKGCERINYGDRMSLLPSCKVVVSATSSPNTTIRPELFENIELDHEIILIDLAVPRDIDPEMANISNIRLYDIDDFRITENEQNFEAFSRAAEILDEEMLEFYRWYEGIDLIPRIMKLEAAVAKDIGLRMARPIRKNHPSEAECHEIFREVDGASCRGINKLLFALKNELSEDRFLECLNILEESYKDEMQD